MTLAHQRTTLILIWCIIVPSIFATFAGNGTGWMRLAPTLILLLAGVAATFILMTTQRAETKTTLSRAKTADLAVKDNSIHQIEFEAWTRRELEVLGLIAQGCTNDEIAAELVIAISTVKTHVNNIYRKLGVRNRVQAVSYARAQGLV